MISLLFSTSENVLLIFTVKIHLKLYFSGLNLAFYKQYDKLLIIKSIARYEILDTFSLISTWRKDSN